MQARSSPDGSRIATLAADGVVRVWDRAGRQTLEDVFLRMTAITGEVPAVRIDTRSKDSAKARTERLRGRRRSA